MLDSLSPFWRHAALLAVMGVITALAGIVTNVVAPQLQAEFPAFGPVIGVLVTLFASYVTKLQTQYGVGSDGEGDAGI
jgi:uncharacterized membrane protein